MYTTAPPASDLATTHDPKSREPLCRRTLSLTLSGKRTHRTERVVAAGWAGSLNIEPVLYSKAGSRWKPIDQVLFHISKADKMLNKKM